MCRDLSGRSRIVVLAIRITGFSLTRGCLTETPTKSLSKTPALLRLEG